jgi:solute carrier family 6 GABA transporter-like protein 6/8/11/12/13
MTLDPSSLKYTKNQVLEMMESGTILMISDSNSKTTSETPSISEESQSNEERPNWGNRVQFLLACVGYSVGLGNVWRFGYLSAKSGGGAFLIPYFITLIIVAIPLMYLEFSIGQFTRRGPIGAISKICPLLKGTGIATVFISFFLSTYYVVIIAWALYFLFASFASEVPWSSCNNTWNTQDCWDGTLNSTLKITNDSKTPSEEFFRNKILNESKSIEDFGMPKWDLVLLVLLVWIIIYFSIWKGVKSTGKVVYVTATFPFLVLTVMLLRGVTLDGAEDGLRFFFVPKWELLLKPSVWANAAIQNFNSIGVAFGGLISMSSYNKPNKRIFGWSGCFDEYYMRQHCF